MYICTLHNLKFINNQIYILYNAILIIINNVNILYFLFILIYEDIMIFTKYTESCSYIIIKKKYSRDNFFLNFFKFDN